MTQLVKLQFDVFENPNEHTRQAIPCPAVLQSHYLEALDTVLVAPLMDPERIPPSSSVAVGVDLAGKSYTLNAALMTNIEARRLTRRLGNLGGYDLEILQAVNRLFVGF